jgi:hypothetical protein
MNYEAHGFCFFWNPAVLIPMILTNVLIALSYIVICASLFEIRKFLLTSKTKIVSDPTIIPTALSSYGFFIVLCGLTHIMDVVVIYAGWYNPQIAVDALCALFSMTTAYFTARIAINMHTVLVEEHKNAA